MQPACHALGSEPREAEFPEFGKNNLVAAVKQANWRVSGGAAGPRGIKPSTLSYRMNAFGISHPRATQ